MAIRDALQEGNIDKTAALGRAAVIFAYRRDAVALRMAIC
jgi:hypothetical protein